MHNLELLQGDARSFFQFGGISQPQTGVYQPVRPSENNLREKQDRHGPTESLTWAGADTEPVCALDFVGCPICGTRTDKACPAIPAQLEKSCIVILRCRKVNKLFK